MTDTNHEQYKQRVEELGRQLLDVIASVSQGDYDVQVDVPKDIEVFADLATGLEFMIEDLRDSARTASTTTPQSDNGATDSQSAALPENGSGQQAPRSFPNANALTYHRSDGIEPKPTWLPVLFARSFSSFSFS